MSWDITREMILCCMSCVAVPSVATLILHALHLIFQQDFLFIAGLHDHSACIHTNKTELCLLCLLIRSLQPSQFFHQMMSGFDNHYLIKRRTELLL